MKLLNFLTVFFFVHRDFYFLLVFHSFDTWFVFSMKPYLATKAVNPPPPKKQNIIAQV